MNSKFDTLLQLCVAAVVFAVATYIAFYSWSHILYHNDPAIQDLRARVEKLEHKL